MKNPNHILFAMLAIIMLFSCKKESYELVTNPEETALETNSVIAILLQRTAMNDGSIDNIIDKANCFTIELPVTVNANNQEVVVTSEDDFNRIEAIFDRFSTDEDILELRYPIQITLNDFTEIIILNEAELFSRANECLGENKADDDIECVDFLYPISASLFDKTTELANRITITDDRQLYEFIDSLDENLVTNLDFPITVTLSDGTETILNNLSNLESFIAAADDECDEDDDYDYNDDDIYTMSEQQFVDVLTVCNLIIEEIHVNDQDLTNSYDQYDFTFHTYGTVDAVLDGAISFGIWSVTSANEDLILHIMMDSLSDLTEDWIVHEIELEDNNTNKIELKNIDDDEVEFLQNCG